MNGSNEESKNVSNSCLSELERVNSYCYLGDNMNGGRESELAVFTQDRAGLKGIQQYVFYVMW